jgi:hypothetical protein
MDPKLAQIIYDQAISDNPHHDEDDDDRDEYATATMEAWRSVDNRGNQFWGCLRLLNFQRSWMRVFPTSKKLILFDGAVTTALQCLLNVNQHDPVCVNPGKSKTPPDTKSLDHSLVCHQCAAPWWKHRHNEGLAALFSTCEQFNVAMQQDVGQLLGTALEAAEDDDDVNGESGGDDDDIMHGTQQTRKRPDGYVVVPIKGDSTGNAVLSMFDFTVVHITATQQNGTHPVTHARGVKIHKYQRLLRHVAMSQGDGAAGVSSAEKITIALNPEVVPIVATAFGLLDRSSVRFLERVSTLSNKPGFVSAAIAAIQVRVLNAQACGMASAKWRLNARASQGKEVVYAKGGVRRQREA